MKKSLVLLLCLVMIASAFMVGCSPKEDKGTETTTAAAGEETTEAKAEPSGTLIVGITEASGNFNPHYYSSAYDGYVVSMVFDSLVVRNFDGEYEPSVADSWEYSEDGKSITFKLKQDRVFSDGTPLTAQDVVFTYQVLADPSYTGRYGSLVKDMLGYDEYYAGTTTDFQGVVAIDDYTVQFNFKEALRVNFANCTSAILPKHYYGKDFKVGDTSAIEAITTEAMGSGPYVVTQFKEKELVYLERNPLYTGEGYMIKEVILKFVDQTTEIVELTTGGVDLLAGQIEPEKIAEARNNGFSINQYNRSGYGYIKLNCQSGPTADKKVRQALYYSFNVKEFVNSYYYDKETDQVLAVVQYHPFSQISWAIDDALLDSMIEYDFDLEKAKALLDEAGWKVGPSGFREKDGQVFELKIAAMPDHDILATLIPMWERDWGQGLNVKLTVAYLEFNTILDYVIYNSDANVDQWSLFFLATTISTPDPHSLYSEFHSDYIGSGLDNTSRYSNPEVDKLLDEAKAIMEIEDAKPIYQQVAKILNEDAVMIPVYANTYFDLYAPKLVDFKTSSLYDWVAALRDAKIVE